MVILIFIIALTIGIIGTYLVLRPSRLKIIEQNQKTAKINEALERQYSELQFNKTKINQEILILKKQRDILLDSFEHEKQQAQQYADTVLEENMKLVNERFDRASEELCKKYQDTEESYVEEYLATMEDCAKEAQEQIQHQNTKLFMIEQKLKEAQSKQAALINILKREEAKRDNINFYRLQLAELDLKEINRLREVGQYLRNEEPLNKVIWKTYYEKPFTDLIGRVIGQKVICGIYKITNIESQKVYIGQSVDIKARWRSHIKRGLGAETPTRNKLYSAMRQDGVENFTYEIIEECERQDLNNRECYWIDFFKSQDYGYNETKGGS